MTLTDSYLKGLQQFKIEEVNIRPLRMSGFISLLFEELEMEGFHSTNAVMFQGLFPVPVSGSGPYNMTLRNVRTSLYIEFNLINNMYLNLNILFVDFTVGTIQTNFTGFGLLTGAFNAIAGVAIRAYLIIERIRINLRIINEFIPVVNIILNKISIIDATLFVINYLRDNILNIISAILRGWLCN